MHQQEITPEVLQGFGIIASIILVCLSVCLYLWLKWRARRIRDNSIHVRVRQVQKAKQDYPLPAAPEREKVMDNFFNFLSQLGILDEERGNLSLKEARLIFSEDALGEMLETLLEYYDDKFRPGAHNYYEEVAQALCLAYKGSPQSYNVIDSMNPNGLTQRNLRSCLLQALSAYTTRTSEEKTETADTKSLEKGDGSCLKMARKIQKKKGRKSRRIKDPKGSVLPFPEAVPTPVLQPAAVSEVRKQEPAAV